MERPFGVRETRGYRDNPGFCAVLAGSAVLTAGALGAVERAAVGGQDVLVGLSGEVAHLLEGGLEVAAVCDPLPVELSIVGR